MANTQTTIVKNASAMLASQVITWSLTLLFAIVLRRSIGPEGSGLLTIASSVWMITGVFIGFGMDTMLTKSIARHPDQASILLSTSLQLRIILFLIGVVVVSVYSQLMRFPPERMTIVYIVGFSTLFMQLANATQATLQGLETMVYISIASIFSKAVNMCLGILVLLLGYGVYAIAGVMVVTSLILFCVQLWFLYRHHHLRLTFQTPHRLQMLKSSLPYVMAAFSITAYSQLDILTISSMVSTTEMGWYDAAIQIFGTLLFGAVVFTTVTFPSMARSHVQDPAAVTSIMRRSLSLIVFISVPIGIGLSLIAGQLMPLLFGSEFAPSGPILSIMGIVLIFMYLNVLFGQYFNSVDRQNIWTTCIIICTIITIPLNLLIVPWCQTTFGIGAIGGAITFLITESVMVLVGLWFLPKGTLTWPTLLYIARVLCAGLVMGGSVWILREQFIFIPVIVGITTYIGLTFLLRLVSKDDMAVLIGYGKKFVARFYKGRAKAVTTRGV